MDIREDYTEALHGSVRPASLGDLSTKAALGRGSQGSQGRAMMHHAPRSAAQRPAEGAAEEATGVLRTPAARSATDADRDAELFARMDALARREAEAEGMDEDGEGLKTGGGHGRGAGAQSDNASETPARVGPGPPTAVRQAGPGGPVHAQANSAPTQGPPAAARPGPPAAASPGLRRGFLSARPVRRATQPAQPGGAAAHVHEQSRTAAELDPGSEPDRGSGSAGRSEGGALPGARPGAVVERPQSARVRAASQGCSPHQGSRPTLGPAGRELADDGRDPGASAGAQQRITPPGAPRGILKQAQECATAADAPAVRPASRFKQLRQARDSM